MPLRHLRPVSARRRLRLTLAALLLPAIGIVVLTQAEPVRRPLAEEEASLAVAMDPIKSIAPPRGPSVPEVPSIAAVALARIGPGVLGGSELALRLVGLFAGALALGATVRLGERLFATRVGVIAAFLLLAAPAGRVLLGTHLSIDPFFLLPMLASLGATRNLARAKVSVIHASVAAGVAIAIGGVAALWLPAMILIWLRRLRGLDLRTFGAIAGWTVGAALLTAWMAAVLVTGHPLGGGVSLFPSTFSGGISPVGLARGLLPILPLAILGAWYLPPKWTRSESLRFIGWWVLASGMGALFTGSIVGPIVGILFFTAAMIAWAFDRAPRSLSWGGALAAGLLIAAVPNRALLRAGSLEPWATRETARFVKHVLPDEGRIAAAEGAARRIAFYSRRDVASLRSPGELREADYAVVDRAAVRALGGEPPTMSRHLAVGPTSMWVIAQFGPWIVARIEHSEDPLPRLSDGSWRTSSRASLESLDR